VAYLVDTNVLLRLVATADPRHAAARGAVEAFEEQTLQTAAQNFQVHDARLVAVMLSNQMRHILTFNARDFQRYEKVGIRAVDPGDL
jgi:predicted nucleic acid-binding protein